MHFLNADSKRIHVVYCAWQHFDAIQPDESVFDKYPELSSSPYFFSLGSRYKHKNIEWVFAAARQNPQYRFAITGYNDVASYSESIVHSAPDNVIFTGYLPDAQIKALMMRCRAFIHPSFSEGFGIPPLEALSVGCEIIVSNASCLPEIYEIYAHYIDPEKYDDICLDDILNPPIENRQELLKKYSWAKSAEKIYRLLETIAEEDT